MRIDGYGSTASTGEDGIEVKVCIRCPLRVYTSMAVGVLVVSEHSQVHICQASVCTKEVVCSSILCVHFC